MGGSNQGYIQDFPAQPLVDPNALPFASLDGQLGANLPSIAHGPGRMAPNQLDDLVLGQGTDMLPSIALPHQVFQPPVGAGDSLMSDTSNYPLGNLDNPAFSQLEPSHITAQRTGNTSLLRSVSDSASRQTMVSDIVAPSDVEDLAATVPSPSDHSNMTNPG